MDVGLPYRTRISSLGTKSESTTAFNERVSPGLLPLTIRSKHIERNSSEQSVGGLAGMTSSAGKRPATRENREYAQSQPNAGNPDGIRPKTDIPFRSRTGIDRQTDSGPGWNHLACGNASTPAIESHGNKSSILGMSGAEKRRTDDEKAADSDDEDDIFARSYRLGTKKLNAARQRDRPLS